MFCLSESDTFYLYPYPTDMRKSFYSLSGIVTNEMKRDVLPIALKRYHCSVVSGTNVALRAVPLVAL